MDTLRTFQFVIAALAAPALLAADSAAPPAHEPWRLDETNASSIDDAPDSVRHTSTPAAQASLVLAWESAELPVPAAQSARVLLQATASVPDPLPPQLFARDRDGQWRALTLSIHQGASVDTPLVAVALLPVEEFASATSLRLYSQSAELTAWSVSLARIVAGDSTVTVIVETTDGDTLTWPTAGSADEPADPPYTVALGPGETAMLSATTHPGGWALESWIVDGRTIRETATLSLDPPSGSDILVVAVYARQGDLNGDGRLGRDDIDAFVLALADPSEFVRRYPDVDPQARGDLDGDGEITPRDIEPFVALLLRRPT